MQSSDFPAILGGIPVRPQGPPPWPIQDDDVFDALTAAFCDGSWGKYHGSCCARLEASLRDYHRIEHALLCGSGTFAVEWALRALRVGPGDEVLLAGYDFPGNFHAVHAVAAMPVLVDVHPGNWNLALDALDRARGPQVKAVIASHLHGGIVPMPALLDWARRHGLAVIEDAAQCPGAVIAGRKAGTWGDAGILSFGGSKLLSAGRGGALLTARADVAQRARTWLFRGNLVCPLSELQAAVLEPQLRKLDHRNAARTEAVALLGRLLEGVPGLRLLHNETAGHLPGYYKVGLQYNRAAFGLDRDAFLAAMRAEGMAVDEGFPALHVGRSPRRFRKGNTLTEAERAHEEMVILHHPLLLEGAAAVEEFVRAVQKLATHFVDKVTG